jgi:hypothetical protein
VFQLPLWGKLTDISVVGGFLDWMTSGDCGRDATTLLQDREDPMLLESCLQPFRLQPSATAQSTHRGMVQPHDMVGELLAQPISGRLHHTASWSSLSEEECMGICATSQVTIVDDAGSVISSTLTPPPRPLPVIASLTGLKSLNAGRPNISRNLPLLLGLTGSFRSL